MLISQTLRARVESAAAYAKWQKLRRMTVANGCTPNEEATARAKIRNMQRQEK